MRYAEKASPKKRANARYRKKNRKRLAEDAKRRRDEERAKSAPTPIDRLYWRQKTKQWRQNMTPEQREAYLQRRRELRAEKKKPQPLEVAA